MNWDDVDVFCQVVEHGGFSAAARALDRPKSSLSAAVIRLEGSLQARLLERTTRRLQLTEAGESLYHGMGPLFAGLREARHEAVAQREGVVGTLRIAAPYEFGAHHVGAVACAMMGRYRQLRVCIDVEHGAVNPLDQRYDVVFAMLEHELPPSSIVLRRMFSLERGVFAAPQLLTHGDPTTPQQLAELPLLAASNDTEWHFTAPDGSTGTVPIDAPRLSSANAEVRLQAAVAGLGVLRITATFAAAAVRAGRLRKLLPNHACEPLRVYALLPAKRLMPRKVRVFLDALEQHSKVIA